MKRPFLPARDDEGAGWPSGYLEQLREYELYWQHRTLDLRAAIDARQRHDELVALDHAATVAALRANRANLEPPVAHVADQQESPEQPSELDHARAILAAHPDISERDLAGALTARTGRKISRRRAVQLRDDVRAGDNLRVVRA